MCDDDDSNKPTLRLHIRQTRISLQPTCKWTMHRTPHPVLFLSSTEVLSTLNPPPTTLHPQLSTLFYALPVTRLPLQHSVYCTCLKRKVYLASTSLTTKSRMEFSGSADCILIFESARCTFTVGATTHSRTLELMALSSVCDGVGWEG